MVLLFLPLVLEHVAITEGTYLSCTFAIFLCLAFFFLSFFLSFLLLLFSFLSFHFCFLFLLFFIFVFYQFDFLSFFFLYLFLSFFSFLYFSFLFPFPFPIASIQNYKYLLVHVQVTEIEFSKRILKNYQFSVKDLQYYLYFSVIATCAITSVKDL